MKQALLPFLRCRACDAQNWELRADHQEADETIEGALACRGCGESLAIERGVLRTVQSDAYVGNFSFEWQLHKKTQLDSAASDNSRRVFCEKSGLDLTQLAGKRVLDVGVGTGRFADVVQRAGAEVVGVDLSFAVETAMENVGRRENAHVVQGDAFDLPFAEETFDLIYSIGVLHHTPDCKRAFQSLIHYLKPGGTIVIWVYDAHVWSPGSLKETVNSAWRSITTRLPSRLLYGLCLLEVPYYYLRKIPKFQNLLHLLLPGVVYHAIPESNNHRQLREHILDTFDWYSPTYQSKHTYPEVFQWFEESGLEHMRALPFPVGISGKKPE